jgi:hypothetical protein
MIVGGGATMRYVEERDFTLRLDLRCEFPEGYEGELDGYAWLREFHAAILPRIVQTVVEVIRREPGWRVRPTNRGRPLEDEVSLVVERQPDGGTG